MASHVQGTVYLLHFDRPYRHAAHYIGWTQDLEARLREHQCGTGARLVEVAVNAGISFELARTWPGDRFLERRIKNLKSGRSVCPICAPKHLRGQFKDRL